MSKYSDINCCEPTRGVDNLLHQYNRDRHRIVQLVEDDPDKLVRVLWRDDGPLSIDKSCLCQMGTGTVRTHYACAQCTNLRRLMDFRKETVNAEFRIECGERAGSSLIIRVVDIPSVHLRWDTKACQRAKRYAEQYPEIHSCGTTRNVGELRMITGDSFSIDIILQLMLHRIFDDNGLPHIPLLETAFICRNRGYQLQYMPDIGPLSELHTITEFHSTPSTPNSIKSQNFATTALKPEISQTIITQLLVILMELSEVNFSHGNPSIYSLIFIEEAISYKYEGVHVKGPITLQLTNFRHSSATFRNVHYFPDDNSCNMYLERSPFIPEITRRTNNTCSASFYRLTDSTIHVYRALRHMGFPLYVGSFDFYSFMVSLMCDHSFYQSVVNNDKLYSWWSLMWTVEDRPIIEGRIRNIHQTEMDISELPALDVIKGAWLRCDIVSYMWSMLKNN